MDAHQAVNRSGGSVERRHPGTSGYAALCQAAATSRFMKGTAVPAWFGAPAPRNPFARSVLKPCGRFVHRSGPRRPAFQKSSFVRPAIPVFRTPIPGFSLGPRLASVLLPSQASVCC